MTLGVLQAMSVIVALTLTLSMSPFVEAMKGGERSKPGEFPHAVQLSSGKTGKVFCGGSIFSPNVVITAAHCVISYWKDYWKIIRLNGLWYPKEYVWVTAGTLENRDMKGIKESGDGNDAMAQVRAVELFAIHPGFNCSSYENDIALLILGHPLNFTDNVKAIQLPPPNVTYSRGTLLGWGYTYRGNLSKPYLKKMEMDFEDRDSCNNDPLMVESKERNVTDLELCTKWGKGFGACGCDSGSSVICRGSNAAIHTNNGTSNSSLPPTICGISTFGIGGGDRCAKSDSIGVFVDVSKYLDWIQKEAERGVDSVKIFKLFEKIDFFISRAFESLLIVLVLLIFFTCILIVVLVGFLIFMCFSKIKKMCLSKAVSESQVA